MYVIRIAFPMKNALDTALLDWLDAEMDRAGSEPILLTGTADAFCAGLNLREVASHDAASMEKFLRHMDAISARLFDHPAPTVAYVNGHAIAGGAVLVCCCDWRIAANEPRAKIGVNEVAIGASYPPRILRILMHRLPSSTRDRILLGAELYAPEVALGLGLVDEITSEGEAAAEKRLKRLAHHPRETYALVKAGMRSGVSTATDLEDRRFVEHALPIWASQAMKDRVLAVLAR